MRNRTIISDDIFKIPDKCRPGEFYSRTKGYRKIEGDVCVDGFVNQYLPQQIPCPISLPDDFLIVAQRDKISRIHLPSGRKEILPVVGLKNVIAIEYDLKSNCVFWADIQTDEIGRQCLNGNRTVEILAESGLSSVEGLSFDWVDELLYFVDGTRFKIEALSTSFTKPRMRKTIIEKLPKPRGIVVHPMAGYLFWTDWSFSQPSISRANLDGSHIRVLFAKRDVVWPNGITIDFSVDRVYWVDASQDYIGSCDLQGGSFVKVLKEDSRASHPFAVAVYKHLMYWDDWKINSIFSADKGDSISYILNVSYNNNTNNFYSQILDQWFILWQRT